MVAHLLTDSRKLLFPDSTLFFALKGPRRDGHEFIPELYERGVRYFVVSDPVNLDTMPEALCLTVNDTLQALQLLVAAHRKKFSIPVVGITGSNGKTIVKEWLHQLLEEQYAVIRSPKSYNSQIGVPLSVWELNETHQLALFEAGISQSGEMDNLQRIIQPTIGIFTNIGEAHSEGFLNKRQKINEKLRLFIDVSALIYRKDDPDVNEAIAGFWQQLHRSGKSPELVSWGSMPDATLQVLTLFKDDGSTRIHASWRGKSEEIRIPFTDEASIENALHCWCLLLYLGIPSAAIRNKMQALAPLSMRLELRQGIQQCTLINDSYSNDINSLKIALNFLTQQARHGRYTVILSDIPESSKPERELYREVAILLQQHGVNRFIGVGERIGHHQEAFKQEAGIQAYFYPDTSSLVSALPHFSFREENILLKGARAFAFERISLMLEQQQHQTVLEINLTALAHNLNRYKQLLRRETKLMAMVKAFAYGAGSHDIARVLQFNKVDYLGVAYTDEAVALREGGIRLPIMIMNMEATSFEKVAYYHFEPVIFSLRSLHDFEHFLKRQGVQQYPIHIEVETGMNRLGFSEEDLPALLHVLHSGIFRVQSVFSHLVASGDNRSDSHTREQANRFEQYVHAIEAAVGYPVLRHLSNTSAVSRFPDLQYEMVRLGIGLYGMDAHCAGLQHVATLRTTIAQLKHVRKGETVGYERAAKISRDSLIATIRIGYADGYPRSLSNGAGAVWIRGCKAPVVGNICMDMTMVDVSAIPGVAEGDEVVVFGESPSVSELAQAAGTIPYEIISGISQRVKRIYIEE
jgi:alanine racemase